MEKILRYFQLPQFLFRLPISFQERMVVAIIYHYQKTGSIKPTQGLINYILGNDTDDKNISKVIRNLEAGEWLRVEREYGKTNTYYLNNKKFMGYITEKDYITIDNNKVEKTPCNSSGETISNEETKKSEGTEPIINWIEVEKKVGYDISGMMHAHTFVKSDIYQFIKDKYSMESIEEINNDFKKYKEWLKRRKMTA